MVAEDQDALKNTEPPNVETVNQEGRGYNLRSLARATRNEILGLQGSDLLKVSRMRARAIPNPFHGRIRKHRPVVKVLVRHTTSRDGAPFSVLAT